MKESSFMWEQTTKRSICLSVRGSGVSVRYLGHLTEIPPKSKAVDDKGIDTSEQSLCISTYVSLSQECFLSKHKIFKLLCWNSSDFGTPHLAGIKVILDSPIQAAILDVSKIEYPVVLSLKPESVQILKASSC
ncbi:unnamed protein product [Cuscuta epithymum]|uniref:Uncharacterized protein n=1 Tax=Cuscuta epithymum TaxID=186058 RepID=A0AAV0C767_9ASTE|nr:unnamed protein product [Cuscuta epithymum]